MCNQQAQKMTTDNSLTKSDKNQPKSSTHISELQKYRHRCFQKMMLDILTLTNQFQQLSIADRMSNKNSLFRFLLINTLSCFLDI